MFLSLKKASRNGFLWFLKILNLAVVASILGGSVCLAEVTFEGLSPKLSFQLRTAFQLAERRLERQSRCSSLFAELEDSGLQLLRVASYVTADEEQDRRFCEGGGVALFTTVNGDSVGICPDAVQRLDRSALAMVLIHEALHMGGMEESPATKGAPTSVELNRLVRQNCSL